MKFNKHRLALGTVQFGLPYGIANRNGQVSFNEVTSILKYAHSHGLNTLDTAFTYGCSEEILGEIGVNTWQIISKLPPFPSNSKDIYKLVLETVQNSLERLKIPRLYGLLLHHPKQLLSSSGEEIYNALTVLKAEKKIEKIGVSIYDPDELESFWPHFKLDIVQAPLNIIDRRIISSGWLNRLHEAGIETHIRSIFLQGLLLMSPKNRPSIFEPWQPLWSQWDHWLKDQSLSPLQACLAFALSESKIHRVIVGVNDLQQLQEIIRTAETASFLEPPETLTSNDLHLINPSYWQIA